MSLARFFTWNNKPPKDDDECTIAINKHGSALDALLGSTDADLCGKWPVGQLVRLELAALREIAREIKS